MVRYGLGGLAFLVVALIALLLVELRREPARELDGERRVEPSGEADGRRAPAHPPAPVRLRGDPESEPEPGEGGEEAKVPPEPTNVDAQDFLARMVPQMIRQAASAACYEEQEGRWEQMELSYRLRFEGGVGVLEQVAMESSELGDRKLEECVVDALRSLQMTYEGAPDIDREMSISISIRSLRRRALDPPNPAIGTR